MALQAAINTGRTKEISNERKINIMLENGFSVFILRWKKIHRFTTFMLGLEIPSFMQRQVTSIGQSSYVTNMQKGEVQFEPDEHGVPVAYIADTPFNKNHLASTYYSAPFIVAGLITPTGTTPGTVVQEELRKIAESLGIKEPVRSRIVGVYGNTLPEKKPTNPKKEEKKIDPANSVFGSDQKKAEVIPVAEPAKKLNKDECEIIGETNILNRYKPFVDKLKTDKGKFWKADKMYKEVIEVEIKKEIKRLFDENGVKETPVTEKPDEREGSTAVTEKTAAA